MANRYKLIISNKRIYKEIGLSEEEHSIKIGTTKNCQVRLNKEWFFEEFELLFEKTKECWQVSCEDNIYISADGIMKLAFRELEHGEHFYIKYQNSNQELFKVNFMIDFDYEKKDYHREINIEHYDEITIGGLSNCHIYLEDDLIGNDVVRIIRKNGIHLISDYQIKYGVYLNGEKLKKPAELENYDFISIIGYTFYYKNGHLYTTVENNYKLNGIDYKDLNYRYGRMSYPKFNRNTRMKSVVSEEAIPILDPPTLGEKPKSNLLMSLFPAFGMLALTVVLRGIMGGGGTFVIFSACTMSMGIITSIITHINGKKDYKNDVKQRIEKYNLYIENKKAEIIQLRQEERNTLDDIYYSTEYEIELVESFSGDLFDRQVEDEDFLHVRLGTGALPARRVVDYKQQEQLETADPLAVIPAQVSQEFKLISQAPIVCDLASANAVGVIGDNRQLYDMLKNMVIDISIRHFQKDVKLFFITSSDNAGMFNWVRLMPHVQNELLNVRNIICDDDSKNLMFEYLYKELSQRETLEISTPKYVVFVYDEMGIKRHPISKYIDKAAELGFTFIFFENHKELLPQGCKRIIRLNKNDTSGSLADSADSNIVVNFSYEPVSDIQASGIATKLAPVYCEDVSLESSLTKNISLYELLGIMSVQDLDIDARWNSSVVYKSMAAPLGVKTKNEIVYLDLHEKAHGPHGLVAGTTGSGKSEILQSYILSMATLFHPYEVSFVIIDFKGGGMVNQFKRLPHLMGAITNIDGKEIDRSLQSIKAELRKRQRLFAQSSVNHIDSYIKKYKAGEVNEPMPHLIIVVDEFAELKAEQPEFMKELISAARIGRSLGVHLILATQKPAGQVNEQIWSNSKFKLCLKVQTKEDSNEVLKSPLAAEIKEPGRTYLQVGNNEIFELFQSAYSGSPAQSDDEAQVKEFKLMEVQFSGRRQIVYEQKRKKSEELVVTQLDAVVDYVGEYCQKRHIPKLPDICLPPLATAVNYHSAPIDKTATTDILVEIGIYDDPSSQYQGPATMNLSAENTMIIGSAQYGKTNLLQTLIRGMAEQYTPEEVSIYIIDFGSMVLKNFEGLNHVGGVVSSSEDEKLKNLFKLLSAEIAARKEKLISVGVSSFSSYKEAGYTDLPQIVLVVDNLTALKELYLQDDDILQILSREGLGVGLSVIIANAQTAGIGYKYLSNFSTRLALYCNDAGEYNSLFNFSPLKPLNTPGRCILEIDRVLYECQTYLAYEGEKEIDRVMEMKSFIEAENAKYADVRAKYIPVIPQLLNEEYMQEQFKYLMKPYKAVVGLDYNDVSPITFDLTSLGILAVSGRAQSGKGNFIKNIVSTLERNKQEAPAEVAIIDNIAKKFTGLQNFDIVKDYSLAAETVKEIIERWDINLQERYQSLVDGDEAALKRAPLLVLIIQNSDAANVISTDKDTLARYKLMASKYKALKICIIYSDLENAPIQYSAPEALKMLKDARHFVVFEDVANLKIMDIPLAASKAFKKTIEVGDGYYIKENDFKKMKTVLHTSRLV